MDSQFLLLTLYISVVNGQIVGPPGIKQQFSSADDYETCDRCHWISPYGAMYDLSVLCQHHFTIWMDNPKASQIAFSVCSTVKCEGYNKAMACIFVPNNKPTSSGQHLVFEPLEPHQPSYGVKITLLDGEICPVTRKPRKTFINLNCDSTYNMDDTSVPGLAPSRAYEGQGEDICNYYIVFPTKYGCPTRPNKYAKLAPQITAVSGCIDSEPLLSTSDCSAGGDATITIHGVDFTAEGQKPVSVTLKVGEQKCTAPTIVDAWTMTCILPAGTGTDLPVHFITKSAVLVKREEPADGTTYEEIHVSNPSVTVSYKPLVDYKRHFDSFLDLGVGGLSKQINELYQRAFASRTVPASVLDRMGIEHAKGILLHGPPGSGKTLLARTIAKILKTEQVKLINAPEIMSKYLGESEKNLRVHFDEAEKAWMEQGEKSDLYIIIIDEIDAICKPRGKADSSAAAAAYDSVVNQLLTKMDGLRSLHNLLVIGMTNRPELIDPALLRPGRFEIQIEIDLPDEEGRWEIFVIHTRQMKENNFLSEDVNLRELAANTTQFSGAEIAGVVRLAASYALDRKYSQQSIEALLVTRHDFCRALQQFQPTYTHKEEDVLQEFLPRGYIKCGKPHDQVVMKVLELTEMLKASNTQSVETVLLYGAKGAGKSGLAAHVSSLVKFSFVKVMTPRSLLGLSDTAKTEGLIETFHDARKSEFGLLVLDDLHNMMEVVHIGGVTSASQNLIHTLSTLLATKVNTEKKLLIVGTLWSDYEDLSKSYTGNVGLQDMFSTHLFVPKLTLPGALTLLSNLSIMRNGREFFRLPQHMSVPLRTMLKITDCIRHKILINQGDLLNTPQYYMDECLAIYPHTEPVASLEI